MAVCLASAPPGEGSIQIKPLEERLRDRVQPKAHLHAPGSGAFKHSVMAMAVSMLLERIVLAGITPLVCTAMAKHVREVVVVKVNAVAIAVEILPVGLAVHEDLHRLAPLLNVRDEDDAQHGR